MRKKLHRHTRVKAFTKPLIVFICLKALWSFFYRKKFDQLFHESGREEGGTRLNEPNPGVKIPHNLKLNLALGVAYLPSVGKP